MRQQAIEIFCSFFAQDRVQSPSWPGECGGAAWQSWPNGLRRYWAAFSLALCLWVPGIYAQDGEPWLFFYNSNAGIAAVGYINSAGTFAQTQALVNGELPSGMAQIVNSDHGLLLYRPSDGIACTGQFNHNGKLLLTGSRCANALGAGWTHVVSLGEHVLFYNSASGAAKVGTLSLTGAFRWLRSIKIAPVTKGYTSAANTRNGTVFHNSSNGAFAVGQFDVQGRFKQTYFVSDQPQAVGFSKIFAAKNNWLLFYGGSGSLKALLNHNGKLAIGQREHWRYDPDILLNVDQWVLSYNPSEDTSSGIFKQFPRGSLSFMDAVGNLNVLGQFYWFSASWTHLVPNGEHVLFYASATGDFAVGRFDPQVLEDEFGTTIKDPGKQPFGWALHVQFVQTHAGSAMFSTGWTHIMSTD